ncbi:MAG TPA: serpin family protein, partial [Chthonomonadaceae bacterium]|nr:serpin family protein [Chthonomonadaceae bacterium]
GVHLRLYRHEMLESRVPRKWQARFGEGLLEKGQVLDTCHLASFLLYNLPYGSGRMSFLIFLPDPGTPISTFLAELTPENFAQWLPQFKTMHGDIALPRFRTEYGADLNEPLKSLGMAVAFDRDRADFSGMLPGGGFYISLVRHKTYVEVNEQGTEAAAATGAVITMKAIIRGFQFVVNRPFVCAIRDEKTGAILFLGRILDPPSTE